MPHRKLLAAGHQSAGLSFFNRQAVSPVAYSEIARAVDTARRDNDRLQIPI